MRPDPKRRADALSRLDWTPPDEAELQRLYERHRPRIWRLIVIGIALGFLLTIVGGRIFGVDLWALVKLGQGASILVALIMRASDYSTAAWRPLSTSEVDEVFGFPMSGYGPRAHPSRKVQWLLKVSNVSTRLTIVLVAASFLVLSVWLVTTSPAYQNHNPGRQGQVLPFASVA
jgi:hypothetical protein